MIEEIRKLKENWSQVKALVAPRETESPQLRFINYFIDHACNLHCHYCRVALQKIPVMDDSTRREVFGKLKVISSDKTILSIVGGEPTRRPEFLTRVIEDATKIGFDVNITTNGYKLDRPLIESLSQVRGPQGQFLRQIALSVDAGEPKNDLAKALGILSIAKENGILPIVNSVISSQTDIKSFKKLADEVISNGFFIVPQIISPEIKGGVFSSADFEDIPTKSQILELAPYLIRKKLIGQVATTVGYIWTVAKLLWSEEGRPGIWHCLPNFRGRNKRGRGHISLDSDGFIGPCQEFPRQINLLAMAPKEISIEFLNAKFKKITQQCRGCFHNCYISEDELRGPRSALGEAMTALAFARVIK